MKVLSWLMDHEFFCRMEKLNWNRKKDKLLNLELTLDIFELIDEERLDVDELMMSLYLLNEIMNDQSKR